MSPKKDFDQRTLAKVVFVQAGALVAPIAGLLTLILIDKNSSHSIIKVDIGEVWELVILLYFCIPFIFGIVGIIFSIMNLRNINKSPTLSILSLLLGIVGLVSPIWLYIVLLYVVFSSYPFTMPL